MAIDLTTQVRSSNQLEPFDRCALDEELRPSEGRGKCEPWSTLGQSEAAAEHYAEDMMGSYKSMAAKIALDATLRALAVSARAPPRSTVTRFGTRY